MPRLHRLRIRIRQSAIVRLAMLACAGLGANNAAQAAARIAEPTFLGWMDGVWRGTTTRYDESGQAHRSFQVEKISTLADGSAKLLEGRAFESLRAAPTQGVVAILSPASERGKYSFRSYAKGASTEAQMTADDRGFAFEVPTPAGPMRITANRDGSTLREVGTIIAAGKAPRKVFESVLRLTQFDAWALPEFQPTETAKPSSPEIVDK
jgi:hypothetical protein